MTVTEPQVAAQAADLVRAFAPYAGPAAFAYAVWLLQDALRSAILRIADRIASFRLKTPAGEAQFDMEKATDEARTASDVLDEIRKRLSQ